MSAVPITPEEAKKRHLAEFVPDEVCATIDDLLERRHGASIRISQREVIEGAIEKMQKDGTCIPREEFYRLGCPWLDIGPIYEQEGWIVRLVGEGQSDAYWVFESF